MKWKFPELIKVSWDYGKFSSIQCCMQVSLLLQLIIFDDHVKFALLHVDAIFSLSCLSFNKCIGNIVHESGFMARKLNHGMVN